MLDLYRPECKLFLAFKLKDNDLNKFADTLQ